MRKNSLILVILLFIVGCKESNNEPDFSLRSKNNKIIGKWYFDSCSFEKSITNINGFLRVTTLFNGSNMSTSIYKGHHTNLTIGNDSNSYSGNLHFFKDGKVNFIEIISVKTIATIKTYSGKWSWGHSKNKKDYLILSFPNTLKSKLMTDNNNSEVLRYHLIELKNKKMFLKSENAYSISDDSTFKRESNISCLYLSK